MVDEIWQEDKLSRKKQSELLRRFIEGQALLRERDGKSKTYVVNLDSAWGQGKTFFLKRFAKDLENSGHVPVYVNAWESDYIDDPLIAVFSDITSQFEDISKKKGIERKVSERVKPLKSRVGKIATNAAIGGLKQAVRKLAGEEEGAELLEEIGVVVIEGVGEHIVNSFEEKKSTIVEFRAQLEELVASVNDATGEDSLVFVLIDELDRCRPNYAVALLERIKHLFSVEGVVFVVATDTEQLSGAIAGVYGHSYDGTRYLRRFFDRTYRFPPVDRRSFIGEVFASLGLREGDFQVPQDYDSERFLLEAFNASKSSLRDIQQMLEILQTFCAVWPYKGVRVVLPYLMPIIFERFSQGLNEFKNEMLGMKFHFQERDDFDRKRRLIEVDLRSYVDKVEKIAEDIFGDRQYQNQSVLDIWAYGTFSEEKSRLYQNSFNAMDRPKSVILEYRSILDMVAVFEEVEG